jgi:prepilin-type N-terminal cleavage/methylation domain-containing protein
MNNQLSKLKSVKKEEGFTIIEVMIVLAIAGLIMLIIFLAVPALQRNSRNTAMKNDAASVAAAVNEYKNNNDGALPAPIDAALVGSAVKIGDVVPKVQANTSVIITGNTAATKTAGATGATYTVAVNSILVATDAKCGTATKGSTTTSVVAKGSAAVFYTAETGGTDAGKCIDV